MKSVLKINQTLAMVLRLMAICGHYKGICYIVKSDNSWVKAGFDESIA